MLIDMFVLLQVCRNLQHTLLFQEDQDDWPLPDIFLLWLHSNVLFRPWDHVRSTGLSRIVSLCAPHLQEYKMRLAQELLS